MAKWPIAQRAQDMEAATWTVERGMRSEDSDKMARWRRERKALQNDRVLTSENQ